MHSYLVFRQKTDIQIEEAVITDFLPGGVIVIVPKLGLEGDVPMQLSQINPVEYSFGTSQRLKLYDTIRVKISISFENFRKKIEISYVEWIIKQRIWLKQFGSLGTYELFTILSIILWSSISSC